MRGSAHASRISEISVPTTVMVLSISTSAPARYISCEVSARSSSGPEVWIFSTTATSVSAEITVTSVQPTVLKKGLSASRTGYFQISTRSSRPLARAVST